MAATKAKTFPQTAAKHYRYTIFPTDLSEPVCTGTVAMTESPGLAELKENVQRVLGCGSLFHITVVDEGEVRDLFIDEMNGMHGLPVNARATELVRAAYLAEHPRIDEASLPVISGPAVIFDEQVWF